MFFQRIDIQICTCYRRKKHTYMKKYKNKIDFFGGFERKLCQIQDDSCVQLKRK